MKKVKRKRKNSSLVHPGLRYAHKNYYLQAKKLFVRKDLFEYKIRFVVKKKQKKLGAISKLCGKFFVSPSKKC